MTSGSKTAIDYATLSSLLESIGLTTSDLESLLGHRLPSRASPELKATIWLYIQSSAIRQAVSKARDYFPECTLKAIR